MPLLSAASSCLFNKQSSRREKRGRQSKGRDERREGGIDGGRGEWERCGHDLTFTHLTIQKVIFLHQRLTWRCMRNIIFPQELSFTDGFLLLSSLPQRISNPGYCVCEAVCVCVSFSVYIVYLLVWAYEWSSKARDENKSKKNKRTRSKARKGFLRVFVFACSCDCTGLKEEMKRTAGGMRGGGREGG